MFSYGRQLFSGHDYVISVKRVRREVALLKGKEEGCPLVIGLKIVVISSQKFVNFLISDCICLFMYNNHIPSYLRVLRLHVYMVVDPVFCHGEE